MKSNTMIQLNAAWWKKEQPPLIKDGVGKRFLGAITDFEAANTALAKSVKAKKQDLSGDVAQVEQKLAALETVGKAALKEIAKLLKSTPKDAKVKKDLENTQDVLGKPLMRELDSIRGSLLGLEEDADEGDLKSEDDYKKYLATMLPRLRKGAFSFALVMPSAKPEEIRMAFHRKKDGKAMTGPLRKAAGGGKFTWGIAAAEKRMDEVDEESGTTLILALDGKRLPGMAKKIKLMFRLMDSKTFKKVKLLVDGKVVETDETEESELPEGEEDKTDTAFPDLGPNVVPDSPEPDPELPKGGASEAELNLLFKSYRDLKAKIVPMIGPAVQRYPEQKAAFAVLVKALGKIETEEEFAKGIAILRDKVVPLLKSSQRLASSNDGNDTDIGKVDLTPGPKLRPDEVLNQGLQKVLARTFPPDNQSKWEVFTSGSKRKITSGADFFKNVKVKFPKGQEPENAEQLREWAINMSILQHMTTKVPQDGPEAKALMKRQMGFLLKFANIPNTGGLNWQANPTQVQDSGTYHRGGGSRLTTKVTTMTARELEVPLANLFLVSDRRVMEEVRRDYTIEGELKPVDGWDDGDYDLVMQHALEGQECYIDCTKLFKSAIESDQPVQSKVEAIIVKLDERSFAKAVSGRGMEGMTQQQLDALGTVADRSGMSKEEIALDERRVTQELALKEAIEGDLKKIREKLKTVRIGGLMAEGEQQALATFPYVTGVTVGGGERLSLDPNDTKKLKEMVNHGGFTVGPEQLLDHWVSKTPNTVEILRELGVTELPSVDFPSGKRLDQFKDFRTDFLGSKPVAAFKDMGSDKDAPPYVKVMADGMISLVEGLQLGTEGYNVKSCLEVAGLGELWSISLNKIQGLMAKATKCQGSMRDFLDQIALIQEEVATLIAVAKPYSKEDFKKGMLEKTDMFPDDFLGDDVMAEFSLRNSASRCFNSVLTACEDMKELLQGEQGHLAKRGLSVLVQGDSYYEPSLYVLGHAKDHSQTGLNTDGLQVGGSEKDFDDQLEEMKRAQVEENKAKLDTYLCEFHHNISYDRQKYSPEDIRLQVRKLIDKGVVANPFTVAIDTTIAKTDEANVKTFLTAFKKEISDGEMNVVIYRSAQKFDQMGSDNYNGGIMCCITANSETGPSPFQRALDGSGELTSEDNMQGLAHLNLSGQEEVNAYRTAIMENTRKIGDPDSGSRAAIPRDMLRTPENEGKSLLQVAVNEDDEAPFLDLKFAFCPYGDEPTDKKSEEWINWKRDKDLAQEVYGSMQDLYLAQAKSDPENSVTSARASFGFQHSNVTLIDGVKLRLNPGLEDEERLKKQTDTLIAVNDMLMTVQKDLEESEDFDPSQLAEMNYYSGMISLHVVEAHTEMKAVLADQRASDKKKDQARLKLAESWCPTGSDRRCANPPGLLRLLDEMSDSFKNKNRRRVEACRAIVAAKYDRSKIKSGDVLGLEKAKVAKAIGHVQQVKDALSEIDKGADAFEQGSAERTAFDELTKWAGDNSAKWSQRSEDALQDALKARLANDPASSKAALDSVNSQEFKDLREADFKPVWEWMEEEYRKRNALAVDDLLALAKSRVDTGRVEEAEPYLVELQRMLDQKMPGLPDGLAGKITGLQDDVKGAAVRRKIDQALDDAAAYEATGQVMEAVKRFTWVDGIMENAKDLVTQEQQTEFERIKPWLEQEVPGRIDAALTQAMGIDPDEKPKEFLKAFAIARATVKTTRPLVSQQQRAIFEGLEKTFKLVEKTLAAK